MSRRLCPALILTAVSVLAGCAALDSAQPLGDGERYYCRPGSLLKYRSPLPSAYPGYWIPMPPGGSCKGY